MPQVLDTYEDVEITFNLRTRLSNDAQIIVHHDYHYNNILWLCIAVILLDESTMFPNICLVMLQKALEILPSYSTFNCLLSWIFRK
jgi:hypothetical protein